MKLVGINNKEDKNNDLFKNNLFDLGVCWAEISMYDSRVTGMVHRLYRIAVSRSFPLGMSLIVGVIGMIVFFRWMFVALADFGSERKKIQRRLKKREVFERYLKYLEESLR